MLSIVDIHIISRKVVAELVVSSCPHFSQSWGPAKQVNRGLAACL